MLQNNTKSIFLDPVPPNEIHSAPQIQLRSYNLWISVWFVHFVYLCFLEVYGLCAQDTCENSPRISTCSLVVVVVIVVFVVVNTTCGVGVAVFLCDFYYFNSLVPRTSPDYLVGESSGFEPRTILSPFWSQLSSSFAICPVAISCLTLL